MMLGTYGSRSWFVNPHCLPRMSTCWMYQPTFCGGCLHNNSWGGDGQGGKGGGGGLIGYLGSGLSL